MLCGAATFGMPGEGFTFGLRTAHFVSNGRVWVCGNTTKCIDVFDTMLDQDDEERLQRQEAASAPAGTVTQLHPDDTDEEKKMTDTSEKPTTNDLQRDLLAFASAATRRALDSLWADGGSVYGTARSLVSRVARGTGYGVAGAVLGSLGGFLITPVRQREESEQDALLRTVSRAQMIREVVPAVTSMFSNMEYEARKRLEDLGFYPCQDCGVPHVKDEPHEMPAGTYWDEERGVYLRPDNADWTKDGYESAAGQRWDFADDDGGDQMH
jgi:hypothetical protein